MYDRTEGGIGLSGLRCWANETAHIRFSKVFPSLPSKQCTVFHSTPRYKYTFIVSNLISNFLFGHPLFRIYVTRNMYAYGVQIATHIYPSYRILARSCAHLYICTDTTRVYAWIQKLSPISCRLWLSTRITYSMMLTCMSISNSSSLSLQHIELQCCRIQLFAKNSSMLFQNECICTRVEYICCFSIKINAVRAMYGANWMCGGFFSCTPMSDLNDVRKW